MKVYLVQSMMQICVMNHITLKMMTKRGLKDESN